VETECLKDQELAERRGHRRIAIRLPVEIRQRRADGLYVVRTITRNLSTGGMFVELDTADFRSADRLDVELRIPAAEGVSPYQGRASCAAEVLRVQEIPAGESESDRQFGIAVRFLDKLRINY